jgi:hypothetical protein
MKIEIKNRWSGSVIFTLEDGTMKLAVKAAVEQKVSLSGAVLSGADLSGADLSGAVLSGAVLSGADLTPIRDDFWNVLISAPREVAALRQALVDGKVDGSTYIGECACLVGTIANTRHCGVNDLGILKPNASRPIERFFCGIDKGDKPETSQFSKLAVEWLDQWVELQKEAALVFSK